MKKQLKRRRVSFDPFSAALGLIGGALLVATAKAVSAMPPEKQIELLKALAAGATQFKLPAPGTVSANAPVAARDLPPGVDLPPPAITPRKKP